MNILNHKQLQDAIDCLQQDKIIAYPTEAVYGLGCNPFSQIAVENLLTLKGRSAAKGFILVAANWDQVRSLVQPVDDNLLQTVLASWPGPVTWVFPAAPAAPVWLMGEHHSLAIRVSDHPIIRQLCEAFDKPMVSTSANFHGEPPARDKALVQHLFADKIAFVTDGKLGGLAKPTTIRDVLTQQILRD